MLRNSHVPVVAISEMTGSPEILGGRVKTLHPKVHGAILADRDNSTHMRDLQQNGILPIDLVVVNLYPFAETVARPDASPADAIEQIDIGGPAMLRAAAKNFQYVTVLVDYMDYDLVLRQLEKNGCGVDLPTRLYLAQKAFAHTAAYDATIVRYMSGLTGTNGKNLEERIIPVFPQYYTVSLEKVQDLRYGENPHQRAAFYRDLASANQDLSYVEVYQGKELSFNNILDLDAAGQLVWEFQAPAAAIIKHTNPCGVAVGETPVEAYLKAYRCDPVSAFGSVLGFNRTVDEPLASEMARTFVEAVIAPDYTPEALELLKAKRNMRVLKYAPDPKQKAELDFRRISGGFLIQEKDYHQLNPDYLQTVTRRKPTKEELHALLFAWSVVKYVKSNAIVYAFQDRTVGIGAGQMSRVDSVKLGAMKAQTALQGSVLASDAFFPFRDGVDEAAKFGVTAIIQPGGSIRDEEVIRAADEHDMAMVFTGARHFKH